MNNFDVIIIGAGPSGLSAAIEAEKNNLNYLVIEKGGIVNSIQNFPAEMTFFSTPELLEIGNIPFTSAEMRPTRVEGLEYYTRVAKFYNLKINFFEEVLSINKNDKQFEIKTNKNNFLSKNVIVATGYYDNPNLLNIKGESLNKVSHYYNEPYKFFNQKVAVVGGKNSAAIAALELFRHGAEVTLIHKNEKLSDSIKYWIKPDLENRIKNGEIKFFPNSKLTEILENEILIMQRNEKLSIKNDFVFLLIGYHPDIKLLRNAKIEIDEENFSPKLFNDFFETSLNGFYVAGSIVAGINNNKIFIENGREHGKIIIEHIKNKLH